MGGESSIFVDLFGCPSFEHHVLVYGALQVDLHFGPPHVDILFGFLPSEGSERGDCQLSGCLVHDWVSLGPGTWVVLARRDCGSCG